MWSRQLSQTSAASSLKFDKSAQKSIVYDMLVVSVLVSAQNSLISDTNRYRRYQRVTSTRCQYRSQPNYSPENRQLEMQGVFARRQSHQTRSAYAFSYSSRMLAMACQQSTHTPLASRCSITYCNGIQDTS